MSALIFEKITQTLAANARLDIGIAGSFFRISECIYPVTVMLIKAGRVIGTMAGMMAGDYASDVEFDGVWIQNGATGQTISIQISDGGAGSDRVTGDVTVVGTVSVAGSVSVINGELSRVKANQCFMRVGYKVQAAGNYSIVQLWNPVASGKNLILNKVSLMVSTSMVGVELKKYSTALSSLLGNGYSKDISAANSSAEVRADHSASSLGTEMQTIGMYNPMDTKDYPFSEPILIRPGNGILLLSSTFNSALWATFQWNEEAI